MFCVHLQPSGVLPLAAGARKMSMAISKIQTHPSPTCLPRASFVVGNSVPSAEAGKSDGTHVPSSPALPIVAEGSAAVRPNRAKASILIGMAYDSVANSLGRSRPRSGESLRCALHRRR
jgi:hypothetical protein